MGTAWATINRGRDTALPCPRYHFDATGNEIGRHRSSLAIVRQTPTLGINPQRTYIQNLIFGDPSINSPDYFYRAQLLILAWL